MNQIASGTRIRLLELTGNPQPFGNAQGKAAFRRLCEIVDAEPRSNIFEISLEGIEATDASFPRESVVSVAKLYRGQKGFFLTNISDPDLIDNWGYAAQAKEQPLVVWHSDGLFQVIGPEISNSAASLLEYVLCNRRVGTAQVAADLEISVPNASTRLKKLVTDGYIWRNEETADSGGIEFQYCAIR
ncbi:winged helix-turn-helix domain-containing protein [Paraburkholderia fungorum]|uniref:winged helix-turn-helix domain-containing protein n=1 Tax=Paraburkholderia fungorum TaxID=134537 RepID=UPI0038BE1482